MKSSYLLILVLVLTSSGFAKSETKDSVISAIINLHSPAGLPYDTDTTDDYIIYRSQYIVSYNPNFNTTNWVSWNLNASWFGKSGRFSGKFVTDMTLPDLFMRITHDDYTNSGYDRGHLVRSHERTVNADDNRSTFYMTNIVAQTPDLNRGVWLKFERYCEELAIKENKELYLYAGGVYKSDSTIGRGVRVPDSCYKIVVVLERGEGAECIDYNTTIYSVMMPNIQGIRNSEWEEFAVSVSHIEQSTGYNFLPGVPEEIQGIIEQYIHKPK
ncbi:MAG: DNA/RNA non-specific endonuclease [Candidatus Kapabacteria bacterium]|nr:DNA/RNA non-specific endonuclease [Ignavibacteriota bacterium]MCW5884444.1 DNA/RNA non-specific endonuclease [Candidatus Kapabacteria bacterium]